MCPPSTFGQNSNEPNKGPALEDLDPALRSQIPNHPACEAAYRHAQSLLPESIFNHSFRVYLYAQAIADQAGLSAPGPTSKPHILFVACILHDIGCAERYNGTQRFEVEAADAAVAHLRQYSDVTEADAQDAWQGIALHTSPGIAERMTHYTKLVRAGVVTDFGGADEPSLPGDLRQLVRRQLPRRQVEKELGDAVAAQAERQPGKAPAASWPGVLLRAKREHPEWTGVNKGFSYQEKED